MKKFLAFTVLISVIIFSGTAFSAEIDLNLLNKLKETVEIFTNSNEKDNTEPAEVSVKVENALTTCPNNSVYMVLKLDNTEALLKWIFSRENIDTFMPLILASEDSNEILGTVEVISAFAENTPLKNAALVVGISDGKIPLPFFQMAFTVKPELSPIIKRISDGSADAVDIAKLFLGFDSPLAAFAESMIKVEKANDNILKIDNELFMKASDNGMIILGMSENDIKASLNAVEHSDSKLFGKYERKFSGKNVAFFHVDTKFAAKLDDDDDKDEDFNIEYLQKVFDKPLNVELDFERMPDKFIISTALNLREAFTKYYAEKTFKDRDNVRVKGGYLNLLGKNSPLFALSGFLDLSLFKDYGHPDTDKIWKNVMRNLRNRFGLSEDDVIEALRGPFSLTVNDNVSVEGIKIPAVYTSIFGKPAKVFDILSKSPHFHKVQEGVLQIDSSVSPISCIVENKNDMLGLHFADLENISSKPEVKPALNELMNKLSISSYWIDFEGIRSWITAPENGILIMLEPLARFTGNGEIFDDVKSVLDAEFSIPSISFWADSQEIMYTQFNISEINSSNGLLRKIIGLSRKYMNKANKTEEKK